MGTVRREDGELNHAGDEKQIRTLIEHWTAAVHSLDITGVLWDEAGDIVMFDVPPPEEGRPWHRLLRPDLAAVVPGAGTRRLVPDRFPGRPG